jgi:hypothetical protein
MEYSITVYKDYLEVATSGDADIATFRSYQDELSNREDCVPGTPRLINHTRLNSGSLTVDEIRGLASRVSASHAEWGYSKMAILVARDLEFGLSRMWGTFVEDELGSGKLAIFRDRDEAISWLLEN